VSCTAGGDLMELREGYGDVSLVAGVFAAWQASSERQGWARRAGVVCVFLACCAGGCVCVAARHAAVSGVCGAAEWLVDGRFGTMTRALSSSLHSCVRRLGLWSAEAGLLHQAGQVVWP
jgi:hypothetical protein